MLTAKHAHCWFLALLAVGTTFTDSSADSALGTVAECLPTNIRVAVNLTRNPHLIPEEMHLTDTSCEATEINKTQAVFIIPFYSCGTTLDASDGNYLVFSNTIYWIATGGVVSFVKDFASTITCEYSRNYTISNGDLQPLTKLTSQDTGYGQFVFTMTIYTDSARLNQLAIADVTVSLNTLLYFTVEVHSSANILVLNLEECWASDVNDAVRYTFIDQGCNSGFDDTLLYNCDNSSSQNFELRSFRLIGAPDNKVYFHCNVKVCLSSAAQSLCTDRCNNCTSAVKRRRRRESEQSQGTGYDNGSLTYSLAVGPYLIKEETSEKDSLSQESGKEESGTPVAVIVIVCICSIVAGSFIVATVLVVIHYRRTKSNTQDEDDVDEKMYKKQRANKMATKKRTDENSSKIML